MRNAIVVILVASAASFLAWYYMGPDRHPSQETSEPQIETAAADVAAEDVAHESNEGSDERSGEENSEESNMTVEEEEASVPVVLTTRVDEIVSLYENASWVHQGLTGPVLYVITFRTCPTCLAFKEMELHGLEEAGVDVRWIVYARRDRPDRARSTTEERAVQAELWLNRDWDLFKEWYAIDPDTFYVTTQLPPLSEETEERTAAVEEARSLVDQLSDLYAENEVDLFSPSLLWQQDGEWVTYVGYEEDSFAPVRDALVGAE